MSSLTTTLGLDNDAAAAAVEAMVREAVATCEVIDVHTHLLPPEHGRLMLWGVDELLTYHYLVAEFFQTAPLSLSHDAFFALPKVLQADLVWQHLFLQRSPVSEACRGVCTSLAMLGLGPELQRRDLAAIRRWFSKQDPAAHTERVFQLARVKYAVMTNVPLDPLEAAQWQPQATPPPATARAGLAANEAAVAASFEPADLAAAAADLAAAADPAAAAADPAPADPAAETAPAPLAPPLPPRYSRRFRAALRVDPLLSGDWRALSLALEAEGFPANVAGAKAYLTQWVGLTKPEYLMASTPHDFKVDDDPLAAFGDGCGCFSAAAPPGPKSPPGAASPGAFGVPPRGRTQTRKNQPHRAATCAAGTAVLGAGAPTAAELLEKVLLPVAEACNLAVAIKIGAVRSLQPGLRSGGDGMATADLADLTRLLVRYPQVKWLATFLSRTNQHEACVLANKFRNLHLYGCWWYCNNPSIIREIVAVRHEMLGAAFTAQHSDCRVLEQLLYKWHHARSIIADVVAADYAKLAHSGWRPSNSDVARDVGRLLGGAYEEFLAK